MGDFSQTEYLTIFLTFIYSIIAAQFFVGWGKWIQNIDQERPSMNHILFSLVVFILLIDFWWISFQRGPGMTQSFRAFFLALISPLTMSVITFNLFPRGRTEDANLAAYFHRRGRFMFLVLAFDLFSNIFVDHYLIGSAIYDLESGFRLSGILYCILGATVSNQTFIRWLLLTGSLVISAHVVLFGEPPPLQEGYSFEEHLTIFVTFVYGVIASRFFSGWSHILTHIKTIQFSKEHLAWSFLAFAVLIDFWWVSWQREPFITKHLGYFLLSLTMPMMFYVLAVVLFPFKEYLDTIRLHDYFEQHSRIILLLFGGIYLLNTIVANVMEGDWRDSENIFRGISFGMAMIAVLVRIATVRWAVLLAGAVFFAVHTFFQ